MSVMKHSFIKRSLLALGALGLTGVCVAAVVIARLPELGSELKSNVSEIHGKRVTFPGKPGFWISYPVESTHKGEAGGSSGISWKARKGLCPTTCNFECDANQCWGSELSHIEGGNWKVDRKYYQMVGRLYFHYSPVTVGTPGSVMLNHEAFERRRHVRGRLFPCASLRPVLTERYRLGSQPNDHR